MRGFTDSLILLLPCWKTVQTWSEDRLRVFNKDILNMVRFVKNKYDMDVYIFRGIEFYPLISTELLSELKIVNALCRMDEEYLKSNEITYREADLAFPEIEAEAIKKYKPVRGIKDFDERDEQTNYRHVYMMKQIVKRHFKVVFDFEGETPRLVSYKAKQDDGKIVVRFHLRDMKAVASWMSGEPFSARILLDYEEAGRHISKWR